MPSNFFKKLTKKRGVKIIHQIER